eukprot:TRINITY_DN15859_c0_g1_i1.p1 TRINITY_DN15859_c0_g1~~TRINITY_DN15859_c0_g1_i1.p1  ORF type:complete len:300 (+),score=67.06 TRINITY_DN15859_c0_g1_i1:364-1263(+)
MAEFLEIGFFECRAYSDFWAHLEQQYGQALANIEKEWNTIRQAATAVSDGLFAQTRAEIKTRINGCKSSIPNVRGYVNQAIDWNGAYQAAKGVKANDQLGVGLTAFKFLALESRVIRLCRRTIKKLTKLVNEVRDMINNLKRTICMAVEGRVGGEVESESELDEVSHNAHHNDEMSVDDDETMDTSSSESDLRNEWLELPQLSPAFDSEFSGEKDDEEHVVVEKNKKREREEPDASEAAPLTSAALPDGIKALLRTSPKPKILVGRKMRIADDSDDEDGEGKPYSMSAPAPKRPCISNL